MKKSGGDCRDLQGGRGNLENPSERDGAFKELRQRRDVWKKKGSTTTQRFKRDEAKRGKK